jgi:hypothetical protein
MKESARIQILREALNRIANSETRISRRGTKENPLVEAAAFADLKRIARLAVIKYLAP